MSKRQSRDRRRQGVRVALSPRDELILRSLGRFRIARTRDLVELAFWGVRSDTASARLRKLFDGGFLAVQVWDRAAENVYSLGSKGRSWLAAHNGESGRLPRGGLDHHLAIVSTWATLARVCFEIRGLRVTLVRPDWEIRKLPDGCPVIPDALIQLDVLGRGAVRLALEVDLGTECITTLRQKVRAYETLRLSDQGLFGWQDFTLAFGLFRAGMGREESITRMLDSVWGGPRLLWDDREGLRAALQMLVNVPLPPLTTSPCRMGRGGDVSRCESNLDQGDLPGSLGERREA